MDADLQQLKDIHLPPAITMWPIAPGWIALFVLLLGLIAWTVFYWYQRKRRSLTIDFALAKLDKLQQLMKKNSEINMAAEVSTLLRRTALYYFPREEIAALSGKQWLEFLNRSNEMTHLTEEMGGLLTNAPYQNKACMHIGPLLEFARACLMGWKMRHPLRHPRMLLAGTPLRWRSPPKACGDDVRDAVRNDTKGTP